MTCQPHNTPNSAQKKYLCEANLELNQVTRAEFRGT